MHTLTTFPRLLDFILLAPFLLRVTVGILRLLAGVVRYKKGPKWISLIYVVSSVFIIVGLYTQISALVAIVLIFFDYYMEKKVGEVAREKKALAILMTIVLISLLFTGPGFWAFDLPL